MDTRPGEQNADDGGHHCPGLFHVKSHHERGGPSAHRGGRISSTDPVARYIPELKNLKVCTGERPIDPVLIDAPMRSRSNIF